MGWFVRSALPRRLLTGVAILWGTATVTFLAMRVVPGDPVDMVIGGEAVLPETVERIRADLGLDRPLPAQYADYLLAMARGDLGTSYQQRRPVTELLTANLGPTAQLAALAAALTVLLALALALSTAGRRGPSRALVSALELGTVAMPSFFIGLVLLYVFSFQLGWFPVTAKSGLVGLTLPAVTLALGSVGVMAQLMRDGLEEALRQPFALTARARGLSRGAVTVAHALRHAFGPVLTMSGTLVGGLVGGAVLVENVFGRAGLGRVTLQAVTTRDMPMVMGVVMLSAVAFTAISIAVDALHRLVDPRLRTRRAAPAPVATETVLAGGVA